MIFVSDDEQVQKEVYELREVLSRADDVWNPLGK